MPSARRAGVPPEVLKEWEADFRQKKAEQAKAGTKRLPSGSVQYEYNGVTYTAKYVGKDLNIILVGNKSDLEENIAITEEEIKNVANQNNFHYILTSAKTGENVNDSFLYIAYRFLESAS
jgi:GTPase SAR1 family protein